jgi:hypothetical protein
MSGLTERDEGGSRDAPVARARARHKACRKTRPLTQRSADALAQPPQPLDRLVLNNTSRTPGSARARHGSSASPPLPDPDPPDAPRAPPVICSAAAIRLSSSLCRRSSGT